MDKLLKIVKNCVEQTISNTFPIFYRENSQIKLVVPEKFKMMLRKEIQKLKISNII